MKQVSADRSKRLDIYARRGDSFALNIRVRNADGTDFDFTDYTVTLKVYTSSSESSPALTFANGSGLALSSGLIELSKTDVQMGLRRRDYIYFLHVTLDGIKTLWLNGSFIINEGKFDGLDVETEEITISQETEDIIIELSIGGSGGGTFRDHNRGYWNAAAGLLPTVDVENYDLYDIILNNPDDAPVDIGGILLPHGCTIKFMGGDPEEITSWKVYY